MEKGITVNTFLLSSKNKIQGDAKVNMDLAQKLCDKNGIGTLIEIPDAKTFKKTGQPYAIMTCLLMPFLVQASTPM